MKKKKVDYSLSIFCILLPLFLILLSYKIVMFFSIFSETQQLVVDFLSKPEQLAPQLIGAGITQAELSHMFDVYAVIVLLNVLFALSFLGIIFIGHTKRKEWARYLYFGGLSSLGIYLLTLLLILFTFRFIFTIFHLVFFPQGNWTFPLDSFLISNFPEMFFIMMAAKIFITATFFASIFIGVGYFFKDENRYKGN